MEKNMKKIIGYMDILGTKKQLDSEHAHEFMKKMIHTYDCITKSLKQITTEQNLPNVDYKIFSDNIIFVMDFNEQNLANFVLIISMFQYALATEKEPLYLRGGICVGEILINDLCVIGPGLVTAYNFENEQAINPRIIIDPELMNSTILKENVIKRHLYTLDDNYYFINYLHWALGEKSKENTLLLHYQNIEKECLTYKNVPGVLSKYKWLKKYLSRFCEKHNIDIIKSDDQGHEQIEEYELPNSIPYSKNEVAKIPVYGLVSAGNGIYAEDDIEDYETADASELRFPQEEYFYLKVRGDSMEPLMIEGDYVLVHKQDIVENGSYGVVLIDKKEGVIKKILKGDGWMELHSINSTYPPRRFEGKDTLRVTTLGLVTSMKRKF